MESYDDFLEIMKINQSSIKDLSEMSDEGGQWEIYTGTYKNMKVIIKRFKNFSDINHKEIKAYLKLKHDIMVEFYGYFIDNDKKLNLVLELADGEELNDLVADELLTYNHKLLIIEKIASLLQYLRINHTIHRDFKPNNFLVKIINDETLSIKVLDFGISKVSNQTNFSQNTSSGTLVYSPPELMSVEVNVKVSFKYDVWSYGLIVSYLFSEEQPWGDKINQMQVEYNLFKKKPYPVPKSIESKNIQKLIDLCTKINPEERINPETILYLIEIIKRGEDIVDIPLDDKNFK